MTCATPQRGYTLIEVMMALVLLAIGATGIWSLQAVAVAGNEGARDQTEGAHVARWWMEQLQRDALNWNGAGTYPTSLDATQYLTRLPPAGGTGWFTPELPLDPELGAGAEQAPMGRDLEILPADPAQGRFCGQVQLTWLRMNRLVRAEVRVWWHAQGADRRLYPRCGLGLEAAMETDLTNVNWLYLVSAVEPPP